jgi:hypothetical protein
MPITINGSGTVTGISAGGLPDAIITAPELSGAQTGSAPIYGCRAWVNFDGTRNAADTGASTNGANVKIRASGNVTSVLKNGTGDYTVTFATAMPDANYTVTGIAGTPGAVAGILHAPVNSSGNQAAGSLRLGTFTGAGSAFDAVFANVAIFR